ncbi:hypothetical protein M4951_00200 [Blastopirellula sp. J2-11]|uniref:hypothetical protein n=1 Tax=Blastopirellula sp. J2-11 TaxID=2943192 RepID=UPI0021C7683F|nr:hypothetical protein [Blastopirellula sp. J2-11]UUO06751.1 hypothetical protein M4951_00200 [Blastopirellula sp. J2-11]
MKVTGYGEDALSLWALTARLNQFLEQLDDQSSLTDTILLLRPSFGRLGSNAVLPGGTADSSQFGEFDAIVGTPIGVYPIEAKWSRSSEIEGDAIILRSAQVRRHQLFYEYLAAWRKHKPTNWAAFHIAQQGLIQLGDIWYPVAPPRSQLSRNLETVLSKLADCGAPVRDVVLYLRVTDGRVVKTVRNEQFQLVTIDCPSATGFIELGDADSLG